jgi:hypothetical protein
MKFILIKKKHTGDWTGSGGVNWRGISIGKSRSNNIRSSGNKFSSISICHCVPVKIVSFLRVNFNLVGSSNSKNLIEKNSFFYTEKKEDNLPMNNSIFI